MENLSFILTCLAIFAGLMLAAALLQRLLCRDTKALSDTHYITYTAMFATMAGVLMLLEIPLPFAPPFYKIDLSELPIMICTFYLGPVAGVTAELVKILVKLVLRGTTTAFVGDFANFAVGCSFVLPASLVYHAKPGKKTALAGLAVGTLCMTVFGSAFNAIYLLPKFAALYGMPMEAIIAMGTKVNARITSVSTLVLFAVVPFNLLKGAIVSALTFLLYKRISPLLHKGDEAIRERRGKKAA
ncbi:MAG: ECF transporter S component [Oscillospiraceae bacterium]|nr:ECF transporter S component [Oscillospiraceae bacterium]